MIKKLEITGVHTDIDLKIKKYVANSVNKLERYIPRHARKSVHVEVTLTENKKQKNNQCTAEFVMYLPKDVLTAKESTINMFAAVDIVETKLHNQIKRYKEKHADPKFFRKLASRFKKANPNQI